MSGFTVPALAAAILCAAASWLAFDAGRLSSWSGHLGAARFGNRPKVREQPREETQSSLLIELAAALLEAGLPLSVCLERLAVVVDSRTKKLLADVSHRLAAGLSWRDSWTGKALEQESEVKRFHDALSFAAQSGSPSADLLRAQAQRMRRLQNRKLQAQASSLGVRLVLPMGLCALPAFISLSVVPILLALLPNL